MLSQYSYSRWGTERWVSYEHFKYFARTERAFERDIGNISRQELLCAEK
jgi:hypothetical protein